MTAGGAVQGGHAEELGCSRHLRSRSAPLEAQLQPGQRLLLFVAQAVTVCIGPHDTGYLGGTRGNETHPVATTRCPAHQRVGQTAGAAEDEREGVGARGCLAREHSQTASGARGIDALGGLVQLGAVHAGGLAPLGRHLEALGQLGHVHAVTVNDPALLAADDHLAGQGQPVELPRAVLVRCRAMDDLAGFRVVEGGIVNPAGVLGQVFDVPHGAVALGAVGTGSNVSALATVVGTLAKIATFSRSRNA